VKPKVLAGVLWRKIVPPRCANYRERLAAFRGAGLEIGGPSGAFRSWGILPVYPFAERVDNCVFTRNTVWKRGNDRYFIAEATRLDFAADASYDFMLSSQMLEHSANPLKALKEWHRVLKRHGTLFITVPDRRFTFDHRRQVTPFAHLVEDSEADRGEDDLTHLAEILALHDLSREPRAMTLEEFKTRSEKNAENRCLHQHVFDRDTLALALEWAGFKVQNVEEVGPHHVAAQALAAA
jgi:SAM-dependent methyltransferase